jgi:pyroglutamyl-peptidase
MSTVLLLGYEGTKEFDPNPAEHVAIAMDGETCAGAKVIGLRVSSDSTKAQKVVTDAIDEYAPDVILVLGVFPGAMGLQVERVAINVMDFQTIDGAGHRWKGVPVRKGGPPAYFATVPVKAMVQAMRRGGVPTRLSNSASTHMCNQALYTELDHIETHGLRTRAGFIHLPNLPEFTAARNEWGPTMSLETMRIGVRAGIGAAVERKEDADTYVEPWEW